MCKTDEIFCTGSRKSGKWRNKIMAEKKIKTIGVLTSGGDAPGMNAAIRADSSTSKLVNSTLI